MALASGGIAKKTVFEAFTGGHAVDTRSENVDVARKIERAQDRRKWIVEHIFPVLRRDFRVWMTAKEIAREIQYLKPDRVTEKDWIQIVTKSMPLVEKSVTHILEYENKRDTTHKVHLYRLKPELWNVDNVARL